MNDICSLIISISLSQKIFGIMGHYVLQVASDEYDKLQSIVKNYQEEEIIKKYKVEKSLF